MSHLRRQLTWSEDVLNEILLRLPQKHLSPFCTGLNKVPLHHTVSLKGGSRHGVEVLSCAKELSLLVFHSVSHSWFQEGYYRAKVTYCESDLRTLLSSISHVSPATNERTLSFEQIIQKQVNFKLPQYKYFNFRNAAQFIFSLIYNTNYRIFVFSGRRHSYQVYQLSSPNSTTP